MNNLYKSSVLIGLLTGTCSLGGVQAATSTQDFVRITDGGLSSPNWVSQNFDGSHYRELLNGTLNASVDSRIGGFDTAISGSAPKVTTKDVHEDTFVEGRFHAFGLDSGEWWYGPKISINWQENGPTDGTDGWFENYIIDSASQTPSQMNARLLNDYESDNPANAFIGETTHDGSVYKHYLVYFREWKQYWAIRQNYRNGGATSIKPILNLWSAHDLSLKDTEDGLSMQDRPFDGVKMNVESNGVVKQNFIFCDTSFPSAYDKAPSQTYPGQAKDAEWCRGPVALLARQKADPSSITMSDLSDVNLEQLDAQYAEDYIEALAEANYGTPIKLADLQAVIDEVNVSVSADIDGDGVFAIDDECRNTTQGLPVDARGCPTPASFALVASDPATGAVSYEELNAVLGSIVVESFMANYEVAIAREKPQTEQALRQLVVNVNDEQLQASGGGSSSSAGGGGTVPLTLLLTLLGLTVLRRVR